MNIFIGLVMSLIAGYIISNLKENIFYQLILLIVFIILLFLSYYKQWGWFKWEQKKSLLITLIIGLLIGYLINQLKILKSINKIDIGTVIVILIILFIGYIGINNLIRSLKYKTPDKTTAGFGYLYGIIFIIMGGFLLFGFMISKEFEPLILSLILFIIGLIMIYLSYKLQKKK